MYFSSEGGEEGGWSFSKLLRVVGGVECIVLSSQTC